MINNIPPKKPQNITKGAKMNSPEASAIFAISDFEDEEGQNMILRRWESENAPRIKSEITSEEKKPWKLPSKAHTPLTLN